MGSPPATDRGLRRGPFGPCRSRSPLEAIDPSAENETDFTVFETSPFIVRAIFRGRSRHAARRAKRRPARPRGPAGGRRAVRPRPRPLCRLPRLSARPGPPAASTLGSTGPAARGCDPRRLPRRAPRPKGVVSSNASRAAAGACFRARLAREPSVGRRLQEDIDELRAPVVDEVAVARRS